MDIIKNRWLFFTTFLFNLLDKIFEEFSIVIISRICFYSSLSAESGSILVELKKLLQIRLLRIYIITV